MKLLRLLIPLILVSNVAHADCPGTLKLCDAALRAEIALRQDDDAQIKNYQTKSALDEQIKSDQQHVIDSPLHDPVKVAMGTTILVIILELITGHLK